jgi:hypothetical protein
VTGSGYKVTPVEAIKVPTIMNHKKGNGNGTGKRERTVKRQVGRKRP